MTRRKDQIICGEATTPTWIVDSIVEGDCFKILPSIPADSVDLVFADPPYFLSGGGTTCRGGKRASVDKGVWDVPTTPDEQHEFDLWWIAMCGRVLHPVGAIWICGTMHNIGSCLLACQRLGFRLLNLVTWKKPAPPPNLSCRMLTHSTEHLIWAKAPPRPGVSHLHRFNYGNMRRRDGAGRQLKDVWEFSRPRAEEYAHGKHPTQKPEALVERALLATTQPGDLVVDPFAGSFTTAAVAKRIGRRCVAIEQDSTWVDVGRQRVAATDLQTDLFEDRAPPRQSI